MVNTGPPSAGDREGAGRLLRASKQLIVRFQLLLALSDSVGGEPGMCRYDYPCPPIGLPTFLRFARFRAICILLPTIGLQVCRETAQSAKGWPFLLFRGRAPATICNNQPDTHAPSTPRRKRNAETRDRGCVVLMGLNVSWQPVQRHLRVWTGQS